MKIQTHRATATTPIPLKLAARALEISPPTLAKSVVAGVIPEITAATLSGLAAVPVLTAAYTESGAPIPVLRGAAQMTSTWDVYDPPRRVAGYDAAMSDEDFLAAFDRWWTRSGADTVLAAGAMIIAIGGWTVGLLAVDGIARELPNGGNCLHYEARLIARCDSVIEQKVRLIDQSDPLAPYAQELLAKRVLGGGGGTITRLPPDATEEAHTAVAS